MGYAVYEDSDARDRGVERWAGYGVPAVCDLPGCDAKIDRGLAYKCENTDGGDNRGEHRGGECMGCGLCFCKAHEFGDHRRITPKPDTAEWKRHMLTDESWAEWRAENPEKTAALAALAESPKAEQARIPTTSEDTCSTCGRILSCVGTCPKGCDR